MQTPEATSSTPITISHSRKVRRLYEEEVARFRSGELRLDGIFRGPLRDNAGELRVPGRVDAAALFEDGDGWFAENIVGSPRP